MMLLPVMYFKKKPNITSINYTVKPHVVATSVMRPPHCSGQLQQVQMYFPLYYMYLIFINRATSLLRPVATYYRTKQVKLIQFSLSKEEEAVKVSLQKVLLLKAYFHY